MVITDRTLEESSNCWKTAKISAAAVHLACDTGSCFDRRTPLARLLCMLVALVTMDGRCVLYLLREAESTARTTKIYIHITSFAKAAAAGAHQLWGCRRRRLSA